jgi:hypothetical protein
MLPNAREARSLPTDELVRRLAELEASLRVRLPDVPPAIHAADDAWIQDLISITRDELRRRKTAAVAS